MKIGIYPGSFNPWHKGHTDIVCKAAEVFDIVVILKMMNPEKWVDKKLFEDSLKNLRVDMEDLIPKELHNRVMIQGDDRALVEVVQDRLYIKGGKREVTGIIRGLRNGNDLQYEMNQQYWNEDVGIKIPFVYFITDRSLAHVSSSAIRSVNQLGLEHGY